MGNLEKIKELLQNDPRGSIILNRWENSDARHDTTKTIEMLCDSIQFKWGMDYKYADKLLAPIGDGSITFTSPDGKTIRLYVKQNPERIDFDCDILILIDTRADLYCPKAPIKQPEGVKPKPIYLVGRSQMRIHGRTWQIELIKYGNNHSIGKRWTIAKTITESQYSPND